MNGYNPTIVEEGLGALAIAASIVSSPIIRPWYSKWGATKSEVSISLPGDDLVPNPVLESTRAITIQTSTANVWPWLVQLGQGRGGLYSYQRLENLIGCDIHNADHILPEFQDLNIGDKVRLGPEGYPAFDVVDIKPERSLVLIGITPGVSMPTTWVWSFLLNPIDESSTRMILRSRLNCESSLGNTIIWRVFTDPISFNMERKMLQGIKARAESLVENQ
ncbi:MAG: hypothetical protein ACK2UM_10190 [Anaerolineales bacterium]